MMERGWEMRDKEEGLSFIFTEWGFLADDGSGELTASMKKWKERFEEERWQALYDLGFQEKGRAVLPLPSCGGWLLPLPMCF